MNKKYLFLSLILVIIIGCNKAVEETDDQTGIKISAAEYNEDNQRIHNIFNFDTVSHEVVVTTLCLDRYGNTIDESDTFNMTLEPESVSGWRPNCPVGTSNYRIVVDNST